MYKVYNLEYYMNDRIIIYLIDKIYEFSKNKIDKDWFYDIHLEGIGNGRTSLFVLNEKNDIIGVCHLKNKDNEQKIYYIDVKEEYKDKGILNLLVEESFKYLNTTKPLVSMPLNNYNKFIGIIEEYNWKLRQIDEECNLYYNGKIKNKKKS